MIQETTTIVNGMVVTHKDVIHHHTDSQFKFLDRIKILFGKKVYIHSEIFTTNEQVDVVASRATTNIQRWTKPKYYGGYAEVNQTASANV